MLEMTPKRRNWQHSSVSEQFIENATLKMSVQSHVTFGVWRCDINGGLLLEMAIHVTHETLSSLHPPND